MGRPKKRPEDKHWQTSVRLVPEERRMVGAWAARHGRLPGTEMRLAVQAHLRVHALHYASSPEGAAELRGQGIDPEQEVAELRASLDRKYSEVFARPEPVDFDVALTGDDDTRRN